MLRSIRIALPVVLLSVITLIATPTFAQTDAQKAFSAIKSLPGTWEGKRPDGHTFQVTYKLTAGGSAVMSEIIVPNEDMISMFHMDGPGKLLLTHYCAAGNQPRMQASVSPDGKTITFNYLDATNLENPDSGHMQRMVLTILDENHHTEEWTFAGQGKEHKQVFDLHRQL